MVNGTKYLDKMFKLIIKHYDLAVECEDTYQWLDRESYALHDALAARQKSSQPEDSA